MDRSLRLGLSIAFAGSGAVALTLQSVWVRAFSRIFGSTTLAVATVVGAFMGGMALGAWWVDRRKGRPLRDWAACEVAIAAAAVGMQPVLAALPLGDLWATFEASPSGLAVARAALAFTLLAAPTVAMGASLPLLARASPDASDLARLYASNTAGAVVGTLSTGLVLVPAVGHRHTALLAALGAAAIAGWGLHIDRSSAAPAITRATPAPWRVEHAVLAASGAAMIALEVLAARGWSLLLGSAGESFSFVLAAVLLGTAAGAGPVGRRVLATTTDVRASLTLWLAGAGAGVVAARRVLPALPDLLFAATQFTGWAPHTVGGQALRAATTLPIAVVGVASGTVWTLAVSALPGSPAANAGRAMVANTLGSLVGSLLAGFVLLPFLGLATALRVAAATFGITAVAISGPGRARWLSAVALVPIVAAPTWDVRPLAFGLMRQTTAERRAATLEGEVVFHADGVASTVTVARHQRGTVENLTLYNNGKPDATSVLDADTQALLGLLPAMIRGDTGLDILVIGYGSGMTVGALAALPSVRSVTVAELEPEVYRAADATFGMFNGRPEADAKVTRLVGDGRHVLTASRQTWDLIVSEPPNPWVAGVADLFHQEFYALAASRLSKDGLLAQWVQAYELSPETLYTVLRTFHHEIPGATAWRLSPSDLLLIGGPGAERLPPDRIGRFAVPTEARAWLSRANVSNGFDLLARFLLSNEQIAEIAGEGRLATDDDGWLEHAAQADRLAALHDPTAGAWLREIGTTMGDRGQVSSIVAKLGPGQTRGAFAADTARALVRARRWTQAATWTTIAKAEGIDVPDLDEAFAKRGKVFTNP